MGASFRNTGQILALAGCDLLTISPELLASLSQAQDDLAASLTPDNARASQPQAVPCNEQHFRFLLNEDAMASEKLSEGIRAFVADARKLDVLIDAQR
jgi:transaldolase